MPSGFEDEEVVIQQARERAMNLLNAVGGDLDSLRAAASDAVHADGLSRCEDIADATRQLMAQLGADLQQNPSSNASPRS